MKQPRGIHDIIVIRAEDDQIRVAARRDRALPVIQPDEPRRTLTHTAHKVIEQAFVGGF
jgi:hypothetical protein